MSEDKCFFCGEERCLVLQCQICHAFNVKKSVNIFTELTTLRGLAKEMGEVIKVVQQYGIEVPHGKNMELATRLLAVRKHGEEILNRPEVVEIMKEGEDE